MTEFLPENSDRNIELRQYRDALAISGGVVIAFSLWDMLKVLIGFFLGEETISEIVSASMGKEQLPENEIGAQIRMWVWVIIVAAIIVIFTLILLYHLYIGLNAYREGRGKAKKKRVVLVLVPHIYMLLYLSGTLAFLAIVDLLRAKEAKTIQSPWKMKALQGQ